MTESDDLFLDDPLMQALLGPASASELAGEGAALQAFRDVRRRGHRRHHLRLVVGGTGVVLALTVSGGVAAAYTGSLPRPLQIAANKLLGPLSVPAPAPHALAPRQDRLRQALPRVTPVPHPSSVRPAPSPTPYAPPSTTPAPAVVTSPSASAAPTPTPSPAPKPVLTARASASTVMVHRGLTLSGTLTRAGAPLAGRTVYAVETVAGSRSGTRVAQATTAADGTVALAVPALTRNVTLRLVTGAKVASGALHVVVLPKVTAALKAGTRSYAVTAKADGGLEGDAAVLQRYDSGTWTDVVSKQLPADLTVRFSVPIPAHDRRYRVRVAASSLHGLGLGPFTARSA